MSYDNTNQPVDDAEVTAVAKVTPVATTAVARIEESPPPKQPSAAAQAKNFDELPILTAAKIALNSGLAKKGETLEQVATRISLGRDLGIGYGASLNGISISPNGAIIMSVALMRLLINSSGRYKLRVKKRDLQGCEVEVFEKMGDGAWESCGVPISFGPEDAKRAKLDQKDTYRAWPVDMYCNRATAAAFRTYTSDCARGVACYLPEELDNSGYRTDVTTGDMVAEAEVKPSKTKPAPAATADPDLLATVQKLITDTRTDSAVLCKQYAVESVEKMDAKQLEAAKRTLSAKLKVQK